VDDDHKRRYEEALAAAEDVIRETPDDATAYHNRGVVLAKLGRYEEAVGAFKKAIKMKPDFARAYYDLGLTYRAMGRYIEAIKALDKAVDIKPNIPAIRDKRAAALIDMGAALRPEYSKSLFEAAIEDARSVIELSTDSDGHYNMACALSRLGRFEEALESLRKAKGAKGIDFDIAHAWDDPDFAPLREKPWLAEFEKVVGPAPKARDAEAW
jgi:tetratricopeptide (TPR) repeat protein